MAGYEPRVQAWLDQAEGLYTAAERRTNPATPLLYYYSFLNVAKTYIAWSGLSLPDAVRHGIADPRVNDQGPADLAGQVVVWDGRARDRSLIFPEFLNLVAKGRPLALQSGSNVPVLDLLADIPVVRRTLQTIEEAAGEPSSFVPLETIGPKYNNSEAWLIGTFRRADRELLDSEVELRNDPRWNGHFEQVRSRNPGEVAFETRATEPWSGRWMDRSLQRLSEQFRRTVPHGAIVMGSTYRYFLQLGANAFPPLAAMYTVMFYLGSVTRYQPHHFRELDDGRHGWLISEVLATVPAQFLYLLASDMAGVEVLPTGASSVT